MKSLIKVGFFWGLLLRNVKVCRSFFYMSCFYMLVVLCWGLFRFVIWYVCFYMFFIRVVVVDVLGVIGYFFDLKVEYWLIGNIKELVDFWKVLLYLI